MWKVVAKSPKGEKSKVSTVWENAMRLVDKGQQKGWKTEVEPLLVDFFVVDVDGELARVAERLSPQTANRYALRWAKMNQNQSGCLIWPIGVPLPAGWTVAKSND